MSLTFLNYFLCLFKNDPVRIFHNPEYSHEIDQVEGFQIVRKSHRMNFESSNRIFDNRNSEATVGCLYKEQLKYVLWTLSKPIRVYTPVPKTVRVDYIDPLPPTKSKILSLLPGFLIREFLKINFIVRFIAIFFFKRNILAYDFVPKWKKKSPTRKINTSWINHKIKIVRKCKLNIPLK